MLSLSGLYQSNTETRFKKTALATAPYVLYSRVTHSLKRLCVKWRRNKLKKIVLVRRSVKYGSFLIDSLHRYEFPSQRKLKKVLPIGVLPGTQVKCQMICAAVQTEKTAVSEEKKYSDRVGNKIKYECFVIFSTARACRFSNYTRARKAQQNVISIWPQSKLLTVLSTPQRTNAQE